MIPTPSFLTSLNVCLPYTPGFTCLAGFDVGYPANPLKVLNRFTLHTPTPLVENGFVEGVAPTLKRSYARCVILILDSSTTGQNNIHADTVGFGSRTRSEHAANYPSQPT
ncbi:hypothetical protein FRC12_010937 [Ceratobasidium sp. 428]|nr:hypothetical protein FRC12_010937 [Ceratobasidium sp. 428]